MNTSIKTPQLPESVADALVITWHKQPGDHVIEDENLVDLETDKVVLEVPAPKSGILKEILQPEGSTVTGEMLLGKIDTSETTQILTTKTDDIETTSTTESFASPSVRQNLLKNNLQESDITSSGKKGHITQDDVAKKVTEISGVTGIYGTREQQRIPMTRLRARMAERLAQAQQTSATLTTFNEIDMQAVINIRNQHKQQFEHSHNVRLGFMSFFIQATCEALKNFPDVNASIDGSDIIYHGYFDVGVAVSSKRGLVVPIIRNADQLGMAGIEQSIVDLSTKAQNGKLTMDDLTGGTFTVSNGGVFGSMLSTPIINPPQSGILGMHKIEKRAVVINDKIEIRPMMFVALSYDHRLIDGKTAVQFLVNIKELIEDPTRLLLDI